MTFDEFLSEKYFQTYYHGTKEGYEESFDNWLSNLDVGEVCEYAEEALALAYKRPTCTHYIPKRLQDKCKICREN